MKKILSLAIVMVIASLNGLFAYSFQSELIDISIAKPDLSQKPKGYISGDAKITVKAKDGQGSFQCAVKISLHREYQNREYSNSPTGVESTSACVGSLTLGNKTINVRKFVLNGTNALEKLNSISLNITATFSVQAGNSKLVMKQENPLFLYWNKKDCLEFSSGNSKYNIALGSLVFEQGKFHIRKGQIEVSNASYTKDRPSRLVFDAKDANNCNVFAIQKGYQKDAQPFGIE